MYEYLELLLHIAKKEGLFGSLKTSTLKISKELNISQQTVSRKLIEMENKELITRAAKPNGLVLSLKNKGRELLQSQYQALSTIFKTKKKELIGIVEKGIGEGKYYMSMNQYQKQFKAKLGFNAFPGTLNLKVNKIESINFLSNLQPIVVSGFTTKSRTYGSLTCYKIKINQVDAAIVIPERTRHEEDIIELISYTNLREKLNLKSGNTVKVVA